MEGILYDLGPRQWGVESVGYALRGLSDLSSFPDIEKDVLT